MIALVWQAIGYYMVMYMASMANVPESLYESAALEGAGKIRQFFTITIPLIWTNIRTTLTFFVISTINMSFLLVKANDKQRKMDGASNILSYISGKRTNSSYGYGMAIGVMVFLFSFALAGILNGNKTSGNRILREGDQDGKNKSKRVKKPLTLSEW